MPKRITTTITLSEEAHSVLTEIARHQLRSRSHTVETLIMQYYEWTLQQRKEAAAEHKVITMNIAGGKS